MYRELLISVPVGFKGTYADFLPVALEVLPFVEGTEKDLKFVLSRLAQLLNEPDRLKAQSGIKDLAEKIKPVEEKSFNAYRAFFNGQKAQARLGDVYGRSADIESTYVEVNKINVRLSKVDFAAIEEQTHRLAELNQQLVELTKQDDNRMVSGSIVAGLYRMIHALAVQVTLGSMMTHTFTDLSSCLATNVKEIVN